MTIEYKITEEDYINFNLYHMQNSPSQKNLYNILRFILPVPLMGYIYFTGTRQLNQPAIYWGIIALGFYVFWIYMYSKLNKRTIRKQSEKMLNEGDNSSLFGKKTLDIVDDVLIITEENATTTLSKDSIKDIKEYDDMLLLYLSAVSAHIIPKRYLSDKDISSIRAILK